MKGGGYTKNCYIYISRRGDAVAESLSEASINADEAEGGHDWCTHEGIDLRWKLYTSFIAGKMRENVFEQTVLEKTIFWKLFKNTFFPIPIIYILEITLFPPPTSGRYKLCWLLYHPDSCKGRL